MFINMWRSSVGNVGNPIGDVYLITDATESEVIAAGFLNTAQLYSEVQLSPNDFIQAVYVSNLSKAPVSAILVPQFGDNNVITAIVIAGTGSVDVPVENAENIGGGLGLFAQKSGSILQFKSFVSVNDSIIPTARGVNEVNLEVGFPTNIVTLPTTLSSLDTGTNVIINSSTNIDITLPTVGVDPNFAIGDTIYLTQLQAGKGHLVVTGSDVLESVGGDDFTEGRGAQSAVTLVAINGSNRTWSFGGQIAANGITANMIYFSKLYGDDTVGIGSPTSPYATIGAAIADAGTPSNNTLIVGLDGETYTEAVTIAHPLINISAPEAILTQTTGSDALTVTTSSAQHLINFGAIIASGGGNAVTNTGTATLTFDCGAVSGPVSTVNGNVFIRSASLQSNLTASGSGYIRYLSAIRSGTNSGNVDGLSPQGVTGTFAIGANTFSATDSTAGYVWTTNGGGVSSLQPLPGSGFTWNGVSGTTQAAAVNNGYIIQNASQTTVTLPATAALGSVISVQGLGAGGWILTANTGQTVQIGSTATSSGGTVTSSNQWDAIEVVCVVANTTWALRAPVTSGFVIA